MQATVLDDFSHFYVFSWNAGERIFVTPGSTTAQADRTLCQSQFMNS